LKDVYFRLNQRIEGVPASLDSLSSHLGVRGMPAPGVGRAGQRLGLLAALTRHLWVQSRELG
jgi:hypothetical protein